MIDFHCHVLNEIDDGAKNLGISMQMCRMAKQNGINHIVATPHVSTLSDVDRFISVRDEKLRILREHLKANGVSINLYPGAEVYVDDDIFFSNNLKKLTINNSRYILVEFSFSGVEIKKIFEYLDEIVSMGLIPIVAHPERYEFFQYDYDAVNSLADKGCIFQINALSLASFDGPQEFELAYAMAYNGLAMLMGTDAHSIHHRPNNLREMMTFFPPDISQFNMQLMLHDSAKCVLLDRPLPFVSKNKIFKRIF